MTQFFEASLSLIVLAIVVGVRFALFLRKRAESRNRNHPPSPLAGIEALEAEGAALDRENFSAWDLSVESPRPPEPVRSAVPPPLFPETPPPPVPAPKSQSEETAAPILAETHRPRANNAFWEKLQGFSPVAQGIILSEILGPPKGLRGSL
ncbi:MAG: hypothetical protein LBP81_04860 [Treponema sp.]|nr:hypothetical protein [Treponema sp.]